MKNLIDFLHESILDTDLDMDETVTENEIVAWIEENTFGTRNIAISGDRDENGAYYVDASYIQIDAGATKLRPDFFVWRKVHTFVCVGNKHITDLSGSPQIVKSFSCRECKKLKSLEGSPKECETFNCAGCQKLVNLQGAPKICKTLNCNRCDIVSLEGAPEVCKCIFCSQCRKLKYDGDTINGYPIYK